jgi:predicted acylesterase/phospholipase RssA
MLPPKRIALSGGGMKGISHIGALEVLKEQGLLRCVKEYIGTSAGALISFAMCIGYTLPEMHTLCIALDFSLTQNIEPDNIFKCMETYGFDDGINTEKLLLILLKAKGLPSSITFEELANRLPDVPSLRVYAVKLQTYAIEEFSLEKTPRVEVKWAVRASMAIPIYFTPMKDLSSNNLYVDGGLIAHFPFHHLTHEERAETLGIAFKRGDTSSEATNLGEYLLKLYYSVYSHQNIQLFESWGHRIIEIDCGNFPSLHFGAESDEKSALIESGADATRKYIYKQKWLSGRMPARRYSLP